MRAVTRNRGVVKAVSPDTSLIDEDNEVVANPVKGKKTEKKSSVVKDENENKFTIDDKPVQLKTVAASPKRSHKTTITVTPQKIEDNLPVKASKKGAFGRLIFLDDDGCAIGATKAATVVTKTSRLVNVVYSQINKSTGALGGNGATGAIYGELTMNSMQKIVNFLVENCELTSKSRFIDIGAGLGKPNFHVAQDVACRLSLGVELETIRWQLSMKNLSDVAARMSDNVGTQDPSLSPELLKLHSGVNFLALDIDDAATLNPLTHIYQYDLGFPPPLQQSIAKKFNTSIYATHFISYRPPDRVMGEYGYEVTPIGQFSTSMCGSGENHTVYFYKRTNPLCVPPPTAVRVLIPGRVGFAEDDEEVVCDPAFLETIKLAVGPVEDLRIHAAKEVKSFLTSGRPERQRRARVIYE